MRKNSFLYCTSPSYKDTNVQKVDSAIHRINHYPVDNTMDFVHTHLLDSDLSGG